MTKVSVVVPCFNGLPYLHETIKSVLSQTFQNWELIYVDDCSKDQSLEVAEAFARQDPRIKVYKNSQNLGMVGNWNRACELSQGEYIKLLCADDILYPNCLEKQVELLDRYPKAGLVTCGSTVINSKGTVIMKRWALGVKPGQGLRELSPSETLGLCLDASGNLMGEPSITLMRRSVVQRVGGFDPSYRYGTDLEYYLRLAVDGGSTVVASDDCLAGFRLHPGSLTNQGMARGSQELMKIFETYVEKDRSIPFDTDRFEKRYAFQVKVKSRIINLAEKPWGIGVLRVLGQLRLMLA